MQIIEHAAAQGEPETTPSQRGGIDLARRGTKTIEQIAAEHRLRFPGPILTGPLAVDIVRADREAR